MLESLSLKEQITKTEHSETWLAFERTKKKRLVLHRFRKELFGAEGETRFDADVNAFAPLDVKPNAELFLKILFHGSEDEWLWFARETSGTHKSLMESVQSGKPLRPMEAAKRFSLLAGLLGEMHALSLVHRNIKPATLYLADKDDTLLSDPDIGHLLDPTVMKDAFQPEILGPADYLAPEQRQYTPEAAAPDSLADQWSFAACIYFATTGKSPTEFNAELVHEFLRPIVVRAMSEDPKARFASMDDLKTALNFAVKKLRPTLFAAQGNDQNAEAAPETLAESVVEALDAVPSPPSAPLQSPAATPVETPAAPAQSAAPNRAIELKCPQCGQAVVANSRHCPHCNRPYEEPCLLCQAPNAFWMKNCKNCGADLAATKHAMHERLYAQQQQIVKLRENYGHDKALVLLRQMSQITHPSFAAIREWAKNLFPIVQKERRDIKMNVENVRQQTKETLEAQMYDKVQQILSQVPAPLVDEEMRKMYAEAGECITEVDSLIREIRNSIATKQYNTLLSCVQRYLELKANDPDARSLQEKIEKLTTMTSVGGIKLRRIPSGRFYMGSHESDEFIRNNERPQHRVPMPKSFFMAVYLITQKDFTRIMEFNPSIATENEIHPVDNVTWYSAIEFCNKLSEEDALPCYYDIQNIKRRSNGAIENATVSILGGDGFRLPTEAEWEYTCRAGSITPWCFGDQILEVGQYAWYFDNSMGETQPVGEKKPNGWGLFDMHGNVMEWCYDWYGEFYYQQCTEEEIPLGPESGTSRSLRGGAWQFGAEATRSAYRNSCNPETSSSLIGFRIARNATDEEIV